MNLTSQKLIAKSSGQKQSEVFDQLADLLLKEELIKTKESLIDGFSKREEQGSTALSNGFAIPHTINEELKEPKVLVLTGASVEDWETLDGSNVDTIISIVVPKNGRNEHLEILSKLSAKLANENFANELKKATKANIEKLINSIMDEEKITKTSNGNIEVVAVTACPTGIAHTYMAAEYLEAAAKELGISIKVETQGQTIQNVLTQSEIDNAKGIVIAADREVDLSRFSNKSVFKTNTKAAIKDAKKLINDALANEGTEVIASSVQATGGASAISNEGEMTLENFGGRAWKAVMNGVSFMLPFVIFGGIMIAISFLIDTAAGHGDAMGGLGTTTGIASFFNSMGGVSMGLMVPVLTAYTMYALIGRPGLLPGFVIGYLAAGSGPLFTTVFGIYEGSGGVPQWLIDINPGFSGTTAASGFIGGIAGAFYGTIIVVGVSSLLDKLPASLRGVKQILLLPLLGTFTAAVTFWFLNIPLIYVTWGLLAALSQLDNWGLTWMLCILLGGMMAIDMGGPINKTAYVFGTVMVGMASPSFTAGYTYMAAVMAGGMVPPLAIAIATLFRRNTIWDAQDRDGGVTNWVMGASFITEGAIPFASKYPKSVYWPNIVGSSVAGLIVGITGVGVAAPHGGVFVLPLVQNMNVWLGMFLYSGAIIAGSAVAALLIVVMRSREVAKQ